MAWTSPLTWQAGQVVTASDLNTHLRDNLNYLLAGSPLSYIVRTGSTDYATSSTTFTDVEATQFSLTLALSSGRALVVATALIVSDNSNGCCYLDWLNVESGARAGGASGLVQNALGVGGTVFNPVTAIGVFNGLPSGLNTFRLQYRGNGNGNAQVLNNGIAVVLLGMEL
jgi:hypothetical protein